MSPALEQNSNDKIHGATNMEFDDGAKLLSDMPPALEQNSNDKSHGATNMDSDHGAKLLSDMPPALEQNSIDPDLEADSDGEDSLAGFGWLRMVVDGAFAIKYPITCSGWTSHDVSYNYWNVYFPFKEVKEEKKRLV
jgi:hypothetical protein